MYRIVVCDGLEYGKRLVKYLELHAKGSYRIYSFSSHASLEAWDQSADLYLFDEKIFMDFWQEEQVGENEINNKDDFGQEKVGDNQANVSKGAGKKSYRYKLKPVILLSNEDKPGCFCRYYPPKRLRQLIEDILFPEKRKKQKNKKQDRKEEGLSLGSQNNEVIDADLVTSSKVNIENHRKSSLWKEIDKRLENNPFSKNKHTLEETVEDSKEVVPEEKHPCQLLGLYVPIHYGNLDQIIEGLIGEHSLVISMEDLNYMDSRHPNTSDLCYYIHIREEEITTRIKEMAIHRGERDWIINQDLYFDLTELKAEDYAWFFEQLRKQREYDRILVIFGYAASHDASFFFAFDQLVLLGIEGHRALQSLLEQIRDLLVRTDSTYEKKVFIKM